jgi:PAS domain S-box-containing protein
LATILIVDDRAPNRQFLVTLLGYSGYRLLEAEDGAQALALVRAEHPDLIITDILMPIMDGYILARQLREEPAFENTPIIFYTATYQSREARALAKAAGVQYVLSKPAEPQVILDLVNRALGRAPMPVPHAEIITKQLLDPLQVVSTKLTDKMTELGSLNRRLSLLIALGVEIGAERDPRRLLEKFCQSARKILNAEFAAVGILAKDGRSLQHFITSGMDPESVARLGPPPTGKGILRILLNEHQPVLLRDLTSDPRSVGFPPGHPLMRSFLGVAIETSMQTYGNLYLTNKIGAEEFSEEDEQLVHALASQVAVAYENAYLYHDIQSHAVKLQLEITERLKAQEALVASEKRSRALIENNNDVIAVFDAQRTILYTSASLTRIFGYTPQEVIGSGLGEYVHPDYHATFESRWDQLLEAPLQVFKMDYLGRHRDGSWRWVEATAQNLLTDPSVQGIVINFRDATDRKQAEAALAQTNDLLSRAEQIGNIGSWAWDIAANHVVWSDGLYKIFGLTSQGFGATYEAYLERVHPQDREFVRLVIETAYRKGVSFEFESRIARADGEMRVVYSRGDAILNDQGEVARLLGIAVDVTDRRQAEAALSASEKRFRALIEHSPDAVAVNAPDGTVLYVSPAVERITGIRATIGDKVNPFEKIHPEDVGLSQQMLEQIIASPGATGTVQFRIRHPDGSWRWLDVISTNLIADPVIGGIISNFGDVTAGKLAEEALAASEKRFRALVENAPDGIALLGMDGKLQQVTPSTEQILGYTLDDATGQDPALLTHPEDLPALLALLGDLMQTPGKIATTQYRFRHKDGSWRWLESTISNLVAEPSVEAIVFNYRDITGNRQAAEQIQRQLKRLSALRTIDTAISSSFDLGVILDVVLREVLSQLEVDASAILLFNAESGTLEYAASRGFHSDILHFTNLKLEEGYAGRAVLERKTIHIPDLMARGGRLARVLQLEHESAADYYGTPLIVKGDVKGVLEIYHRSHLKAEPEWLEFLETLAREAAIAIDNAQLFDSLQRSNAELEARVTARTEELYRTNIELEHANRTKDEFLAAMSHELRTPLNSILGLSETLLEQRRDPLSERQQKSLHVIQSSGSHLLELINDILDLSKIEAGKFDYHPQALSVDEICRSSMAFVKTQAMKKSITVTYDNETSIPRIHADPRRLKQILVNLLTNAVKFTPENGHVSLQVNSEVEQDVFQFSVIDTGIGIAPEDLQRLFQPFVQVDSKLNRQHEGTGLGLALVQRLTDLHGGSVHVESEVGKGSRFTIRLPLSNSILARQEAIDLGGELLSSEQRETKDLPPAEQPDGGTILLAEDNAANILTISEYLESHGYQVVVAHDGFEAIEKAEEIQPKAILMDIQMPAMDGLEAMRRLRADPQFAGMPIIALTALAMPGDRERCLLAGASEYMSKPVSLKKLRQTIENLLQR